MLISKYGPMLGGVQKVLEYAVFHIPLFEVPIKTLFQFTKNLIKTLYVLSIPIYLKAPLKMPSSLIIALKKLSSYL